MAGYYLSGPEAVDGFHVGPASGKVITGATLQGQGNTVIDESGCAPGTGGCPQFDEDGDGTTGKDPINFLNDDRDSWNEKPFIDEDPRERPNRISGMQALHGP